MEKHKKRRMKKAFIGAIVGASCVAFATACSSNTGDELPDMPQPTTRQEVLHEKNASPGESNVAGDITANIEVGQEEGKTVFTLSVQNQMEQEQPMTFTSGQKYDYKIYDAQGNLIYTWSADKSFIQMKVEETLKQGETWTFEEEAPDLTSGEYSVEFVFLAQEKPLSTKMDFEVNEHHS